MGKIHKNFNIIALIFTLIGVFLWTNLAYSVSDLSNLRPPLQSNSISGETRALLVQEEAVSQIGYLITESGERLYMRKEDNITTYGDYVGFFVLFYNEEGERVGHVDIMPDNFLINNVYVEPSFRNRGYSVAFSDAVLKGMRQGVLLEGEIGSFKVYLRNPLLLKTVSRYGLIINPNPHPAMQGLMTKVVISKERDRDKIPLYIEDAQKRENIRDHIADPKNTDWHIFEAGDEPIEGEEGIIFAEYFFPDTDTLDGLLKAVGTQVVFYPLDASPAEALSIAWKGGVISNIAVERASRTEIESRL